MLLKKPDFEQFSGGVPFWTSTPLSLSIPPWRRVLQLGMPWALFRLKTALQIMMSGGPNFAMNSSICNIYIYIFSFLLSAMQNSGGPTAEELIKLLDQCDLSNSHCSTPCISPCLSLVGVTPRIKTANVAFLNQSTEQVTDPQPQQS